jgi:adenylate cyclase
VNKFKQALIAIMIAIVFIFVYSTTYNQAESKVYDYMVKHVLTQKLPFDMNKKCDGSDDIVLIVIDSKTVEKYRWPWKREVNCKIFDFFSSYAKPKVVVSDSILLTLDKEHPDSDKKYFNSLKKMDNLVVGFMPSINSWEDKDFGEMFDSQFKKYSLNLIDNTSKSPLLYESILPLPKLYMDSIKYTGSVSMISGAINGNIGRYSIDEVYRNHEYFLKYNNGIYPSLALRAFLIAKNNPKIVISDKSLEFPELNYKINLQKNKYQSISPLRFYKTSYGVYSHQNYSAVDIMDSFEALENGKKPIIAPDAFNDKIVVIGANVPAGTGLNDNKNTSVSINHPGVDIQATAIDNIMHNDFITILPSWFNLLITLLGMLLVFKSIKNCNLYKSVVFTLVLLGVYLFISFVCFYFKIIINIITPIVMFILTTILGYTHKYILENRSKEKVKTAMGKFMSKGVMQNVIQNIDNLGLGGKRSVVTVLFADIRGFTTLSEQISPQEVSKILNEYFTEMEPIITEHNGIINKFIGDAIMAIFGEPIQDKNHAMNAVKCAYKMIQRVDKLQSKWEQEGKPKIEIGVGIATGEVFVGNIGSINRMEYTVIGDTVNLASRLEGYNKTYKSKILINTKTYESVKNIADVVKLSDVQIRGKAKKIDIYEVLKVKI